MSRAWTSRWHGCNAGGGKIITAGLREAGVGPAARRCSAVASARVRALMLVVAVGLVGGATSATPAVAKARSVLPKGTPYAAETKVEIAGQVSLHYHDVNVTQQVCPSSDPSSATTDRNWEFGFSWAAKYPQVTVPVITTKHLGAAWHRLHLRVQPTSDGTGGLVDSTYTIGGYGPPTTNGDGSPSDCAQQPVQQSGSFTAAGLPTSVDTDRGDIFAQLVHRFEFIMPAAYAQPASYTDYQGQQQTVEDALTEATNSVPGAGSWSAGHPDWDTMLANLPDQMLVPLAKPNVHQVTIHQDYDSPTLGHDCSSPNTDPAVSTDTCTVEWSYDWTIVLQKRFLYRTRKAYHR
jgi:hypothetical protein